MSKLFYVINNPVNLCKGCQHSKDRYKESCYCVQYGIIISYGKKACKGYKAKKKMEDENDE